jgi:hypothetical protein
VDRKELVYRFEFDDQGIFDEDINHVPSIHVCTLVLNGKGSLTNVGDPSQAELVA